MREIPILFSTPMIRAIFDNRKFMTRRLRGLDKINENPDQWILRQITIDEPGDLLAWFEHKETYEHVKIKCPYGKPGDILWCRETWKYYEKAVGRGEGFHIKKFVAYKADEENDSVQKSCEWYEGKWRPSIHMPRSVCRLFLMNKNIRIERLQDITEEDAEAEGVTDPYDYQRPEYYEQPYMRGLGINKSAFAGLWDIINSKCGHGWKKNDWTWVIVFERTDNRG